MDLTEALEQHFGFGTFRAGQEDVAQSVLDGRHALAVMPTGAGKSLCYQLPSCMVEGVTLVVSPLIALMKDQVDSARSRGIAATSINSSISRQAQQERLRGIRSGKYTLVYVAPERFRSQAFLEVLEHVKVSLFAVDEAHCISQWGHDFRPDYLTLGEVRKSLGSPVTLALTATATPEVQSDILVQLGVQDARVIVSGFDRPNLFFEVQHARNDEEKMSQIKRVLREHPGESALIYCSTRKQVDEVRARLQHANLLVEGYHGGLSDRRREDIQEAFMSGDIPILVATNAFGMGVDKSDVRVIVHYNLPGSIEAYYQEAGRAGRDGGAAYCVLQYNPNDRGVHDFFIDLAFPTSDVVMSVWAELRRYGLGTHAVGAEQISNHMNRSSRKANTHAGTVEAALRMLKQSAHIDFGWRDGFPWVTVGDLSRTRDLRVDWDHVALRREIALRQLNDVVRYASVQNCRQVQLLKHFRARASFGDQCRNCDCCCGSPPIAISEPAPIPDSLPILIRKALSGVARTHGKCGSHLICAMLRGSTSKLVLRQGLNQLSTYGVLDYLTPESLAGTLELCERHRMVVRTSKGHISLTPAGVSVMQGEAEMPAGLRSAVGKRIH